MKHSRDLAQTATPTLRIPTAEDGTAIWELVRACKPLDENSIYCNLLQCDHFADTCVLAEIDGEVVGWVSGYILPGEPDTLFVWQVAVGEKARGYGLGVTMLREILSRDICDDVVKLKTTITGCNDASWGLFRKFARKMGGEMSHEAHYKADDHFQGRAKTENMVTIDFSEAEAKAA